MRRLWKYWTGHAVLIAAGMLLAACQLSAPPRVTGTESAVSPATTNTPSAQPAAAPDKPHIDVTVDNPAPHVGDTFQLTADAVGIGMPLYNVSITSGDRTEAVFSGNNITKLQDFAVEVLYAEHHNDSITLILKAMKAGPLHVDISASGEVSVPQPNGSPAFMWGGGGGSVEVTVSD